MQPATIGTAGPAGHGKTALVRALTGRTAGTPEEGEGVLDLGFAFAEVGGERLGVVDQPGNERLVRTLLGDLHGIDLVLLVVAADQGVQPQTEECVDILHLLEARATALVITRTDLVDAPRVDEVRAAIDALVCGTRLERAPVHAVSSVTGEGIPALRDDVRRLTRTRAEPRDDGFFRMFVDRSFVAPSGLPTVTGTVLAGTLRSGDAVAIRPGVRPAEVDAIQVHGETVARAHAGQRVAIRLRALDRKHVRRGVVLADPRVEFVTDRFDCRIEVRPGARAALRSFDRVEIDVGTVETAGTVVVLEPGELLAPGARGYCQIALERETVLALGDRFVLRPAGAARTTGGGSVLHPFAVRHASSEPKVAERLARLESPGLPARLLAFLDLLPEAAAPAGYLAQGLGAGLDEVRRAAGGVPEILALPGASDPQAYATRERWERVVAGVGDVLARHHRAHPLEGGMEPEALRARLRTPVPPRLLDAVVGRLVADAALVRDGDLLRLARHRPGPPAARPARTARPAPAPRPTPGSAASVRESIVAGGMAPPDHRQLAVTAQLSAERLASILTALEREGAIVAIAPDIHLDRAAYDRARAVLVDHLTEHGTITVADYRTQLSTSRKYALALLEHFDHEGLTERDGDLRRPKR
jgi:selenocysteine-specific elongation factor